MDSEKPIRKIVMKHLKKMKSDFENNPFNFLSEDDVKCHLFMKLFKEFKFSKLKKTEDDQSISPLHSEVRYFNEQGKLLFQVDISAIDPQYANVYSKRVKEGRKRPMLAKRYEFDKSHFSIEIKLNKGVWSKNYTYKIWEKDLQKLRDIKSRNSTMFCFSLLLDRRGHFTERDLEELRNSYPHIEIIYGRSVK